MTKIMTDTTVSEILTALGNKVNAMEQTFLQETFTVSESNTFVLRATPTFVFAVAVLNDTIYTQVDYTRAENRLTIAIPLSTGDIVSIKYAVSAETVPPLPPYSVGAGGGGHLVYPAFNPQDSNNIFVACDMGSAFVSHDGGVTFNSTPTWGHAGVPNWAFNPHDKNIVYAMIAPYGDNPPFCIYISHDKGRSWEPLSPSADEIAGLAYFHWGDHEQVSLPVYKTGTFTFSSSLRMICVHPTDPNMLFAVTAGKTNVKAMIYQSTDGGKTWTVITELAPATPVVSNSYTRMCVVGSVLHVINNTGLYNHNLETGIDTSNLFKNSYGAIQAKGSQVTVIMITDQGVTFDSARYHNAVAVSTDFGVTWRSMTSLFIEDARTKAGLTLTEHQQQQYHVTPVKIKYQALALSGNTVYIGFKGGDWRSEGAAKTTDFGETWTLAYMGRHQDTYDQQFTEPALLDTVIPNTTVASAATTAFSGAAPGHAVATEDGNLVILTSMADAMISIDGGLMWRSLASRRVDYGRKPVPQKSEVPFWKTAGIEPAGQSILAVNPFNKKHHLAGWTDNAIMESFDGGNTWTLKYPKDMNHANCHAIAFDPHNKGVVLAAPTTVQAAVGANASIEQGLVYVNSTTLNTAGNVPRIGGIARSTDSGATWTISYNGTTTANVLSDPTNAGLPTRCVVSGIVFDPINEGVVYASVLGGGVYKSTDGGTSWSAFNEGIALQTNKAGQTGILIHRLILGQDNRTLFALLYDTDLTRDANNIRVRRAPAYYLDLRRQETVWTELNRPNDMLGNTLVALDMDKNGVIYAVPVITLKDWTAVSFNGGMRNDYIRGGVYVSEDMGASWRQTYYEHLRVLDIHVDSRNTNTLYMTTGHGKVYMSKKGKNTIPIDWQELPNVNYYSLRYIFEDPQDSKRIYVTTVGGGTWSLSTAVQ